MGGDRFNDDGARGISSKYFWKYCGNDSEEGRRWGMEVGLGGGGIGDHWTLDDKGLCEEVSGNNIVIFSRETNIQNLYMQRSDGGVQ